jgi:hypothetical protein
MLLGGGSSCQQCGCPPGCECNIFDAPEIIWSSADSVTKLASTFLTGSAARVITAIQLRTPVWTAENSTNFYGDGAPAKLEIWSNKLRTPNQTIVDFIPDAPLHTLTFPTTLGENVTFTSSGYTVSANTYYWVVLSIAGRWTFTNHNLCIDDTVPYCQIRYADFTYPYFGDSSWLVGSGGPYAFRLIGDEI